MKKIIFVLSVVLAVLGMLVFAFIGCSTVATTSTSTTTYTSATLTHWGFDFATGAQGEDEGYDGCVITWNTYSVITTVEGTTYPSYSTYVWWRASANIDPYQKHMGEVSLEAITSIPSTWDSGSSLWPLLVGHSYVVKCSPEGYAKFYVTSTEVSPSWEAEVEYSYTSGTTF